MILKYRFLEREVSFLTSPRGATGKVFFLLSTKSGILRRKTETYGVLHKRFIQGGLKI